MSKAIIVNKPQDGRGFSSVTTNPSKPQRETLEEILINLATSIGAGKILKAQNSRGSYFYEVQAPGFCCYQSATNTILELSQAILKKNK